MGLFRDDNATDRVGFPDGAWVELRCYISTADDRAAVDAATKDGAIFEQASGNRAQRRGRQDAGGQTRQRFSTLEYDLTILEKQIVSWSEEAPVTRDNIGRLDKAITDALLDKLDEWNKPRTEDERRPLSMTSSSSSAPALDSGKPEVVLSGRKN